MTARPSLGPSSGVIPGAAFFTEYRAAMKGLFDAANFPLTAVAGTANDVTASLAWDLDGGVLLTGMKFTLTWAATNTGPVTLEINGGAPADVLSADGSVLSAGAVPAGMRSMVEYTGGDFRILNSAIGGGAGAAAERYYQVFTVSGTWNKPAGLNENTSVRVQLWGAGGGGSSNNDWGAGGGGGAFVEHIYRLGDLPASVAVSIGAGGGWDSVGGSTSFGTFLNAPGGGTASGPDGATGGNGASPYGLQIPLWRGGNGSTASADGAIFGGGGGGRTGGGQSVYGGAGGSNGGAGSAPGGGGGRRGNGARGEARIWI